MSDTSVNTSDADHEGDLKRSITGRLLFFYVLGDVLGSGIYVLIGLVAGAVGGAFFVAFAVGVTVATVTGMAYAELATKFPRAAGAALYINKAFGNRTLTFMVTVLFLAVELRGGGLAGLRLRPLLRGGVERPAGPGGRPGVHRCCSRW